MIPQDSALSVAPARGPRIAAARARKVLLDNGGRSLDGPAFPGAHHTLGEELLRPSVIYAPSMLELRRHVDVRMRRRLGKRSHDRVR